MGAEGAYAWYGGAAGADELGDWIVAYVSDWVYDGLGVRESDCVD